MNEDTKKLEPLEEGLEKQEAEKKAAANKKMNLLYTLLIIIFSVLFICSALYIGAYFMESAKEQENHEELASMKESVSQELPPNETDPIIIEHPVSGEEVTILPEYAALFKKNPDLVGWIEIEGTKVNYPVMHTPADMDYYLYRNFDKEDSKHGAIFVQGACDVIKPSDNVTIYGHNMRDDTMFGDLDNYLKKSFWEEHRYIQFDTLKERHTYEIIAVFITTASLNKGFAYHAFVDAATEEDFNNFVTTAKRLSLYDTGLTAEYGDKLICLSTCEYTQTNGRLVVMAKRIS